MKVAVIVLVGLFSLFGTALGEEDTGQDVSEAFSQFGYTVQRDLSKGCNVIMSLDRDEFVKSIPELTKIGLLNPEYVTQTRINTEPTTIAMAFALQVAPTTIKEVYESEKSANLCTFVQKVLIQDDYGNDKSEELFRFQFTRAIYSKVNWDKFPAQNLAKIAPKFGFGPAMSIVMKEKNDAGD